MKKAKNRVRDWLLHNIPDALKKYLEKDPAGLSIFVNEVNCGNARCAPVHVSITLLSKEPGKLHRTIDIPKALADVRQKDVADFIDFVRDDLLACITHDAPTRKRPRTHLECMKDPGSAGFFGKLLRAHDSATDALLAAVAKVMEEEPDYADQIEGNFNASHTERMKALVEAVLAYYNADQVDDPAVLYQKLVNVGAPPLVFRLLGKSVDAERELRGLDELLHRIKDVVVLNCDDLEPLILMAIEEAAAMAQELWRDGQIGRVAFDTNAPMPLELLEVVAAKVGGERTDMLLKVMAERRRDFLMKASPSDGKCVTCPVCLKEIAPEKMRSHFLPQYAVTACYEELLKILNDDGCTFWYCGEGPKGGCRDRFCARRRPTRRNQRQWPFLRKILRDNHERRGDVVFYCDGIGCRLGDKCQRRHGLGLPFTRKEHLKTHKTGDAPRPGSMRFEGFDEDVEVYVDYEGSKIVDPIKRARGFIKKITRGGSTTIKFDDPALGEKKFHNGFKLTRLLDGVTYVRSRKRSRKRERPFPFATSDEGLVATRVPHCKFCGKPRKGHPRICPASKKRRGASPGL